IFHEWTFKRSWTYVTKLIKDCGSIASSCKSSWRGLPCLEAREFDPGDRARARIELSTSAKFPIDHTSPASVAPEPNSASINAVGVCGKMCSIDEITLASSNRKKLAAFSAAAGRFLQFPIGDRRCNRTRASVGNAGGNARQALQTRL